MSKRKTYEECISDLNLKARNELYDLLHAKGIRRLELSGDIQVVSQHPGGKFDLFPVKVLEFVDQGSCGDVLCFDYEGGIEWYLNPVIWCQIRDEVRKKLNA